MIFTSRLYYPGTVLDRCALLGCALLEPWDAAALADRLGPRCCQLATRERRDGKCKLLATIPITNQCREVPAPWVGKAGPLAGINFEATSAAELHANKNGLQHGAQEVKTLAILAVECREGSEGSETSCCLV